MAADSQKPNLILINIDDLGYAEIGPFGGKTPTPNLDRMAKEGRKLTSHYAAPVCSPSRASMMTGCYPKRVLPISGVLFPAGAVGLNPEERTVAEVLKDAGYATACVGKWHLGDQPEFLPTRQGFDSYYGIPYSNDMGPGAEGSKSNPGKPLPKGPGKGKKANLPEDKEGIGIRGGQPPLPLMEGTNAIERVRAEQQHTITQRYTEKAQAFIRAQKEGPFFLYLPHTAVHFPHYPRKDLIGKSGGALYQDWVMEVDWSVGQILDTLRELQIEGRTLVVFTSDNGGPLQQDAHNEPLRGGKGSTLEGGVRVCTIAWWPGKVPAGTSVDAITTHMDFLPTFAALGGGKAPADRKLDGHDISKLLLDAKATESPYEAFYYFRGLKLEAVRSGPWKLHLAKGELYHLGDDIGESKNIAAQNAAEVTRLRGLAAKMDEDLGNDGVGPGVRALGRVANPKPIISLEGGVREDAAGKFKQLP
ncbi:MAG: sulfatase [Prosthecobacter sp.]|nr:sulfatase [Prosthecobacter sp.]